MMQIIQKWQIQLRGGPGASAVREFYISDNFYENVLRKLSEISFDNVEQIVIQKVKFTDSRQIGGNLTESIAKYPQDT